jgi:hypothetical protein
MKTFALGILISLGLAQLPITVSGGGAARIVWFGASGGGTLSATTFEGNPGLGVSATESTRQVSAPATGTATLLSCNSSAVQSATGNLVVTLRNNTANTALAFTILANGAGGTYSSSGAVPITAGDLLSIQMANAATANGPVLYCSVTIQ